MKSFASTHASLLTIALLAFAGCSREMPAVSDRSAPPATATGHDHHAHPAEGPHHGTLVELGSDQYHAEVLHDEATDTITLYILDSGATQQIPIDATEVTVNAKHDGKPVQFKLAASPDAGDPAGKSSRFTSSDQELAHCLDDEQADPRLVISIDGKSYRGAIAHGHDHAGHDHAGHEH